MDEIMTLTALALAVGIFGFLFGMIALSRAKMIAAANNRPVPRIPGLSPEQTFGLGGVVMSVGGILLLLWRG